jgi:hypothetical protein
LSEGTVASHASVAAFTSKFGLGCAAAGTFNVGGEVFSVELCALQVNVKAVKKPVRTTRRKTVLIIFSQLFMNDSKARFNARSWVEHISQRIPDEVKS